MNARLRRITADYEEIKKNFEGHKNIIVEPIGPEPAEKYTVTYYINGICLDEGGRVQTVNKHIVTITLHSEYPRYKPICNIETPIWHPNFKDGQICIGDIWGAGESLCDIIVNIGDMIQYKSWNSFSPLSAAAAKWAIANKHLFPIGNIDLWTGEEVSGTLTSNFEIDIFEDDSQEVSESNKSDTIESAQIEENVVAEKNESDENESIFDENQLTKENETYEESSQIASVILEEENENDFDITSEELEGIEFVPTAARMQVNQYDTDQKGGKVNFKTIFFKGILYGLIGGIFAWLLQEIAPIESEKILAWGGHSVESLARDLRLGKITQAQYSSFIGSSILMESSLFSAIIGGVTGAVMGIGEGIYYGSKEKAVKYGFIGLGVALIIGLIGGVIGQLLYSELLKDATEYASEIYLAFVRAIGWSVIGAGVGIAIGLIRPEKMRIINCLLGGVAGGFIGGFLFNFIEVPINIGSKDVGMVSRAIGITIMGTLIGLGIGLLEQFAKSAWLKVIRGEFEGKEYLVFKGVTSVGNSGKNTIALFKDKLVAPNHCDIVQEGNKYVLVDRGTPSGTLVNGMRVTRHTLKQGDAISLGNSVLIFNTK